MRAAVKETLHESDINDMSSQKINDGYLQNSMENISGKISKSLITCYVNLGMENQKKKKFNPGGTQNISRPRGTFPPYRLIIPNNT